MKRYVVGAVGSRVYYINLNAQGDGYVEPAAVEDSESRCVLAPVTGI